MILNGVGATLYKFGLHGFPGICVRYARGVFSIVALPKMTESTCGTVSNQKVGHRKRWRSLNTRHSVACFGGDASPFLVRILGGVNII